MPELSSHLKNIKSNIRKIRMEKNITQAKLSELSGVPIRTIENIESEKRTDDPKITTILKIVFALGITVNDLYL